MRGKAAFTEPDREAGLSAAAVAEGDDLCNVLPWLRHGFEWEM